MKLAGANITGVSFDGDEFTDTSMKNRDLRTGNLRGVFVNSGDWSGVNAAGVDMSLAGAGRGSGQNQAGIILTGANFEGANLEGFSFGAWSPLLGSIAVTNANFKNANLQGASFEEITFQNCDFTGADLSFADVIAAKFPGCTGLNPEQPGMQFGAGPSGPGTPNAPGTTLPDGSARLGTNPGVGLAPAIIVPRLHFSITDGGTNGPIDLSITGTSFNNGTQQGTYSWSSRGRVGRVQLKYNNGTVQSYALLFTSGTDGLLFHDQPVYLIGTFTVPQQ